MFSFDFFAIHVSTRIRPKNEISAPLESCVHILEFCIYLNAFVILIFFGSLKLIQYCQPGIDQSQKKTIQRVSNADRKVFANAESFCNKLIFS